MEQQNDIIVQSVIARELGALPSTTSCDANDNTLYLVNNNIRIMSNISQSIYPACTGLGTGREQAGEHLSGNDLAIKQSPIKLLLSQSTDLFSWPLVS
jgi:hypothetical protein